jgi:hypothetical protein
MKKGDLVMFIDDTGRYAKWFFGQMGELDKDPSKGTDGKLHVSISWLRPVKYHDSHATISHFSADKFRVICASR